jgi:hypothetical protein
VAAGTVGLALALAGVDSPLRVPLLLLFLAVAPAVAVAGLLRGFDTLAVLVVSGGATIAINSLVAATMLTLGVWSPRAGLLAVAAITAVCLAGQLPAVRTLVTRRSSPQRTAPQRHAAWTGRRRASTRSGRAAERAPNAIHQTAEAGMANRLEEAGTAVMGAVPALRPATPAATAARTAAARTTTARPRRPPVPTDAATAQFPAFRPHEPAGAATARGRATRPHEPEASTDTPAAQIPATRPQEAEEPTDAPTAQIPAVRPTE